MNRQFRSYTRKENRKISEPCSKILKSVKNNTENVSQYQRLTFVDIQKITRKMLHDSKAHEKNMGVISSIKGKMYCLKLGEVSSSKQFSHYFYSNQFRLRQQKGEPLKKISSNSMWSRNQNIF